MYYNELFAKLIILTKRNDITHAEIGDCMRIERGAAFARAKRNSKVKDNEVKKVEEKYDVDLSSVSITENSGERQNDTSIPSRAAEFGYRLGDLQDKHGYLDKDMAKILHLSEDDYIDIKCGDIEPDVQVLHRLKQCFKVCIDDLLYGG